VQLWREGLPNAVPLPGSQQVGGRSSFSHNKPSIIISQTVPSSGKLASASRASFPPTLTGNDLPRERKKKKKNRRK